MQPSIYGCMQEDVKEVLESHKVIAKCHSSFLSAKQTFQVLFDNLMVECCVLTIT